MKTLGRILLVPALLAATTAGGLVAALISDETGDVLGAACLAIEVIAGIRPLIRWRRC